VLLLEAGGGPDAASNTALGRSEPRGWSRLERAGSIRDVLHAGTVRLDRVFRDDRPRLAAIRIDAPRPGDNDWDPRIILACLTANAERLARSIEGATADAWHRSAVHGTGAVTAIDLLGEILDEINRHLRPHGRAAGTASRPGAAGR
jgi:hypothetical protein